MEDAYINSRSNRIIKLVHSIMEDKFSLNAHNKDEFPPAHTAEHLLNQTMIRMFGCERSTNAHVERKRVKSVIYSIISRAGMKRKRLKNA